MYLAKLKLKAKTRFIVTTIVAILAAIFILAPGKTLAATTNPVGKCDKNATGVNNCIVIDLNYLINILAAGVGLVVVGTIIVGGIQYSTAGDKPEDVTKAKQRIMNGLIALVAFIFMWAFLQWLIPGGVFK